MLGSLQWSLLLFGTLDSAVLVVLIIRFPNTFIQVCARVCFRSSFAGPSGRVDLQCCSVVTRNAKSSVCS